MSKSNDPSVLSSGNYYLHYDKGRNYIFISLPQTEETINNTVEEIERRKVDVPANELFLVLNLVKLIFGRRTDDG